MNEILLTLGGLTLGGSAAVVLLALLGRNTRGRYGAKWRGRGGGGRGLGGGGSPALGGPLPEEGPPPRGGAQPPPPG